jgi:hypothetical protein
MGLVEALVILDTCRERGIVLQLDNGQIRWAAPNGTMSLRLLRAIKSSRADLIEALEMQQRSGQVRKNGPIPVAFEFGDVPS